MNDEISRTDEMERIKMANKAAVVETHNMSRR